MSAELVPRARRALFAPQELASVMSIRIQRSFPFAVLAAIALGVVVWSSSRRAHAATLAPRNDPLEQAMGQMNEALKVLGKGITAENRAASLEELGKFETAVIAAKAQTPDTAAKVDEKKRAEFVADFRKQLCDAMRLALDAETAVLNGKYKDADALVRNKLEGLKSAGHSKFKGPDKEGK
jgi:hypothetical protein